jgi:hypothetical protein
MLKLVEKKEGAQFLSPCGWRQLVGTCNEKADNVAFLDYRPAFSSGRVGNGEAGLWCSQSVLANGIALYRTRTSQRGGSISFAAYQSPAPPKLTLVKSFCTRAILKQPQFRQLL